MMTYLIPENTNVLIPPDGGMVLEGSKLLLGDLADLV